WVCDMSYVKDESVYVCCLCEPDANLDNAAAPLATISCDRHGYCWHREMIRGADGSLTVANRRYAPARATSFNSSDFRWGGLTESLRIRKFLDSDLHDAKRRREVASNAFHTIIREVPSGLPHPDGTQRIRNASRAYSN